MSKVRIRVLHLQLLCETGKVRKLGKVRGEGVREGKRKRGRGREKERKRERD